MAAGGSTRHRGFREYGARVIASRMRKMLSYTDAVRLARDPEAVHAMRVASRRLRAALAVFGPAFECPTFRSLEREVRTITRALGAARDLDVMIDELQRLDEGIPTTRRAALERFIEEKRRLRRLAQPPVIRALDRLARRDLPAMFARAAAEATGAPDPTARSGAQSADAAPVPEERV